MRIYIAYKFLGSDKDGLKATLTALASMIEEAGCTPYIFYRDRQNWGTAQIPIDKIMIMAFEELQKSDILLLFVESDEKSEGMLLEAGFAKAMGKKIILAVKKDIKLRFLKTIADEMIYFETIGDLKKPLKAIIKKINKKR